MDNWVTGKRLSPTVYVPAWLSPTTCIKMVTVTVFKEYPDGQAVYAYQ